MINNPSGLIAEAREFADDAEKCFEPGWPVEMVRTLCDRVERLEADVAALGDVVAWTSQATHEGHYWRVEVFDARNDLVAWALSPDLSEAQRIATGEAS